MTEKAMTDRAGVVYPPVIFDCRLEGLLRKKMGEGYSVTAVAAKLDVAPLTMRRILDGCVVSLENAMRLAALAGRPLGDIWKLKSR